MRFVCPNSTYRTAWAPRLPPSKAVGRCRPLRKLAKRTTASTRRGDDADNHASSGKTELAANKAADKGRLDDVLGMATVVLLALAIVFTLVFTFTLVKMPTDTADLIPFFLLICIPLAPLEYFWR